MKTTDPFAWKHLPQRFENEPPDDWFSWCYRRTPDWLRLPIQWLVDRGFLYRTLYRCAFTTTYRWQWRFWRGPYWKYRDAVGKPFDRTRTD